MKNDEIRGTIDEYINQLVRILNTAIGELAAAKQHYDFQQGTTSNKVIACKELGRHDFDENGICCDCGAEFRSIESLKEEQSKDVPLNDEYIAENLKKSKNSPK